MNIIHLDSSTLDHPNRFSQDSHTTTHNLGGDEGVYELTVVNASLPVATIGLPAERSATS